MTLLCMNQACAFRALSVQKACASMQPIRVETSPGHVEIALLHVIESEGSSHTDLRVAAIYDRSPIHTFLFDSEGSMLTANQAALLAHQRSALGELTHIRPATVLLLSQFQQSCSIYSLCEADIMQIDMPTRQAETAKQDSSAFLLHAEFF